MFEVILITIRVLSVRSTIIFCTLITIHIRYVSECLGGAVERSGPFGYELAAGELQRQLKSNTVPLGEITAGGFRHRALLFKV